MTRAAGGNCSIIVLSIAGSKTFFRKFGQQFLALTTTETLYYEK
jgi:hypothetical protein